MVQNVCLGAGGKPLSGRSPLDAGCTQQRDLLPGERLPYHKHDQPSPDERADAPEGYQRHDSIPVPTAGEGIAIEHSFDFGAGEGRRFGAFDAGSDGGDLVILSAGVASIGATEDGGAGFQLFVGECRGTVDATALRHAWIVADLAASQPGTLQGETVARLKDLRAAQQSDCPDRYSAAYTNWRVIPFRYRAAPGQGSPVTLTTLLSEHYGGMNRANADHVERFYFTRELGGTRWERWQNVQGNQQASPERITQQAAWFAGTGRCSHADPPEGGATMVLIDCREWSHIVPASDPDGDAPGFFVKALRERGMAPPFLAAPDPR
ncbi:MAG: hypothetical protein JO001_19370 [Alphaproteobacteria bacterium]|nr:hypothetical protein [Alphaproteobacteria bacterium]